VSATSTNESQDVNGDLTDRADEDNLVMARNFWFQALMSQAVISRAFARNTPLYSDVAIRLRI
jgi:hypothetical protein